MERINREEPSIALLEELEELEERRLLVTVKVLDLNYETEDKRSVEEKMNEIINEQNRLLADYSKWCFEINRLH